MNIAELIKGIRQELTPFLDHDKINVEFNEANSGINVCIVVFYDKGSTNFSTYFWDHNPMPNTVKGIVAEIIKEAKEIGIPLKKPSTGTSKKFNTGTLNVF